MEFDTIADAEGGLGSARFAPLHARLVPSPKEVAYNPARSGNQGAPRINDGFVVVDSPPQGSGFAQVSKVVGWEGLEPSTNGLKGRCSTD